MSGLSPIPEAERFRKGDEVLMTRGRGANEVRVVVKDDGGPHVICLAPHRPSVTKGYLRASLRPVSR